MGVLLARISSRPIQTHWRRHQPAVLGFSLVEDWLFRQDGYLVLARGAAADSGVRAVGGEQI